MTIVGDFELVCNTTDDVKVLNNVINGKRLIPHFHTQPPHDGVAVIVGGGPSLASGLGEIKSRQHNGAKVWATNNTYRFLTSNGIKPDAHVFLDARVQNIEFLEASQGVVYYINVSCHPALFDALEDYDVCLYDLGGAATGTTVGLKALYLAGFSGFKEFYLYGFDSSYRDDKHHAYAQPINDEENIIEMVVEGRTFRCAPWMAIQAEEFQSIATSFAEQDKIIHVAGDGLLPFVAHRMVRPTNILTAVWDLHLCSTNYDFGTFLNEAENKRLEINADAIDLIIQPGPVNGFRNGDITLSPGTRDGMLYRVTVGMARLLPSIRNIEILKIRRSVFADNIFPDGYTIQSPVSRYGAHYIKNATPVLKASVAAKEYIRKKYTKPYTRDNRPYLTITLRQSPTHQPTRNSNITAWDRVAKWIERSGYTVVMVPDAESKDANLFSFDVDMRLALYEGAVLNLGINNGPMMILPHTSAHYMLFKIVTEGIPWTERAYHEKVSLIEGDQPNARGRLIFGPDDYETIIAELSKYLEVPLQKEMTA